MFYVFVAYTYDGGSMYGPFPTIEEARAKAEPEDRFAETWIIKGELTA